MMTCHSNTQAEPWISREHVPGLVSVIIPTHNRADLIGETIDSVFSQTYRPVECIVVDDGSTDDTEAVVRAKFLNSPAGITAQYHKQPKSGGPAARNRGIRAARGEFIQFLDSDDVLLPAKLSTQIAFMRGHPAMGCVYSFSEAFDARPPHRTVSRVYHDPRDKLRAVLSGDYFLCSIEAVLWRRQSVLENGPWDERLVRHQEWDYMVRYLSRKGQLACLRRVLSRFRIHPGRLTQTKHSRTRELDAHSVYLAREKAFSQIAEAGPVYINALAGNVWRGVARRRFEPNYPCVAENRDLLERMRRHCRLPWYVELSLKAGVESKLRLIRPLLFWHAVKRRLERVAAFRPPCGSVCNASFDVSSGIAERIRTPPTEGGNHRR